MAGEMAETQVGPGPAESHAARNESAIKSHARDRTAFDRADIDQGRLPAAKNEHEGCETRLPDDGSDADPAHLIVRLKEPLQQERTTQQTDSV